MVRTNSSMLPLGTVLPAFDLEVVPRKRLLLNDQQILRERISNKSLERKPLLLMFICAHCPFVKHIEPELTRLDEDYRNLVQILAISSNSLITHPQDGPENLARQAEKFGWHFPYLLDSEQTLAKSLKAACTPDFFLFAPFDKAGQKLFYRGQLDQSRPGNELPVNGHDLRQALDALLAGESLINEQKPSIGCNIKWHPGKEPSWFG